MTFVTFVNYSLMVVLLEMWREMWSLLIVVQHFQTHTAANLFFVAVLHMYSYMQTVLFMVLKQQQSWIYYIEIVGWCLYWFFFQMGLCTHICILLTGIFCAIYDCAPWWPASQFGGEVVVEVIYLVNKNDTHYIKKMHCLYLI